MWALARQGSTAACWQNIAAWCRIEWPWSLSQYVDRGDMAIDTQQKLLLFGAAAAVRLALFTVFPALPALLAGRVEVSTPVTSFKRCMHSTRDIVVSHMHHG
jgi:hypothetical protein